ncbi:MAG: RdgB/HAM1 family non-canonical purine NTP pyrophosphatase [Candidatus Hydrogenedentes bacterium]|nr:RdgB/HAM1 family non-canonical purine NTP pyrophosphatase [Candidatus Hydrogenedentota bacterium]
MSPRPLLIATGNAHKFGEIAVFLENVPWQLMSLRDFPEFDAPEENGDSFEANALIKAQAYGARFGVACVADDSGLVVDALGGAPGIYSARYAGNGCTDADNNEKLLHELRDVADELRSARFVCCCVLAVPGEMPHMELGTIEGRIARAVSGKGGFGYDPLFIPNGYDRTFGALVPEVKASISHRARAFAKLREYLLRANV